MNRLWSAPELVRIAELVTQRTGLVFAPNRCESLEQAVRHVMRDRSLTDLAEFERQLVSGVLPWDPLIQQMTVGETYFFRDKEHFEFIAEQVLPELAERRGPMYRPRVWSAGCATGEEAYSLAIALQELEMLAGAFVLGTDLSRAALDRARKGRYKKWSLRGFEPRLLEKYFEWAEAEVVLAPAIRERVTFQELNLAGVGYPSPVTCTFAMDVILCRNVLIYLGPEAIASVGRRFFECLSPGGYLIAGPSDPLLADAGFEILTKRAGVVYRRPANPLPARRSSRPPAAVVVAPAVSREPSCPARPASESLPERARQAESEKDERALQELASAHPSESWLAALALRARSKAAPAKVVEVECRAVLARHPLSAELHYLHALSLLGSSRPAQAAEALRRAIYLEPSLAIAHFTLGTVLADLRDGAGAERAYRNAEQCSGARPADEPVPLANEISAKGLASAAARELSVLRGRSVSR